MAPTTTERVFGIGELVESILLHLPDTPVDKQHEPLFQLFVLQSLNRTTNLAIKSSKRLRQHMFLEPRDTTPMAARMPTTWLLRQVGIAVVLPLDAALLDIRIEGLGLNGVVNCKVQGYLRDLITAFSKVEAYRSLAWVHLKAPEQGVSIKNLDMRVQIGSEYIWDFGAGAKELTRWWRDGVLNTMWAERWEFGEEVTVGDLLDKYLEVMRRTPAEHRLQQSVHAKAISGRT
ncbi:hypothetical protein CLAFUW4_06632 [Fulvia fulva]|uniref:Uncharacterized protein n=1 Tax=Passalora fulva TaxID=5499 RepID=A0A9Q8PBI0_PASFU|nr:uncharacterized protein CLAFUR5_06777 [Fulvia fulva]KAK4621394.1 hypothetical protein CLAFUR4_06640 [Fulvia fulva]KAK4623313.1 hypothetical protein CLAFUR0_06634 [Fulvia fulva]UJO19396.1 hypothetical protein CLAFUR5_06777 [Fulvia fulva]WPV16085.1 hypothetical protein CLAFUW4_06632 [Fulvia fulva]WPV31696.1 hypothetical protein CLAFUW7_06631 [Fulvia fulva]